MQIMTAHNNKKRQTSLSLVAFEPTIPASKWPQTHALDGAATGISIKLLQTTKLQGQTHASV